jgi:alkylation response protein AidB-like acyl-CoA dehydrogenase
MDFRLGDDDALLVDNVRAFCRDRVADQAAAWDDAGCIPPAVLGELGELGLLGMRVSEAEGGVALSTVAATAIVEELAIGSASLALVVSAHNFLAVAHIVAAGSPEQRRTLLPDLVSGRRIGAWALSETVSGSDAAAAQTTATAREGGGWKLDGQKAYVTSGGHAGRIVVFAAVEPGDREAGLSAFVVDREQTGLGLEPVRPLGMRATSLSHLVLSGACVDDDRRLGALGSGLPTAKALLHESRIAIAALSCGITAAALTAARDYALERRQFGQPIADFQAIQWKLADIAMGLDAARLLTRRAAWLADAGQPFAAFASRAKLHASELACRATSEALQIHGGYGYTREFVVERLLRDAHACRIAEGTSQIQRLLLAREIAARSR